MERTKPSKSNQIQVLSDLVARASLANRMLGYQYGGDRDVYQALGYKRDLTYEDYRIQYSRQDIAKAIINRPVEATWRGKITIVEEGKKKDEDTQFQKALNELNKRLELKSKFSRLDKLSSLGNYGALLLGLDDTQNKMGFALPVSSGDRKLLYLKPLGEGSAEIATWEVRTDNPRYGLPKIYNVCIIQPGTSSSTILKVHYTRLIHVAGELMESEVEGVPQLKAVFNRLKDLEKIVGGSAEMYWRGARPGYDAKVDEGFNMTPESKADLQDQFDEYENNLRRFLQTNGVTVKSLDTQVSDPKGHVDVQLQMISAETRIPQRILTGSERGELASSQDTDAWLTRVVERREEFAEPQIVNPFINRCVEYGILPDPGEFEVLWTDLFSPSAKEKAEIGKTRAEALKAYTTNPIAESIISPEGFMHIMLGLNPEEIEQMTEMIGNLGDAERRLAAQIELDN